MPSVANVTTTAPVGAGETATALVLNGVRRIEIDIRKEMLFVTQDDGRVVEFAYDTVATVTYTIASKVATVTVST